MHMLPASIPCGPEPTCSRIMWATRDCGSRRRISVVRPKCQSRTLRQGRASCRPYGHSNFDLTNCRVAVCGSTNIVESANQSATAPPPAWRNTGIGASSSVVRHDEQPQTWQNTCTNTSVATLTNLAIMHAPRQLPPSRHRWR